MSKRLSLLLTTVILFISAIYPQKNNIVLWSSGGYSDFFENADKLTSVGNAGAELGVGYEFAARNFIFQTGVGYQHLNASLQLQDSLHNRMMIDTEGDIYNGYFSFSNNNDLYRMGNVVIPLLFGAKYNKFYALAGVKIGLNITATSTHSSNIRSFADYGQFINFFEDMPNHGFLTREEKNTYDVKFDTNYSASIEFGYNFKLGTNKKSLVSYRIGAFADYGLNNINTKNNAEADLILNDNNAAYIPYFNSTLLSRDFKGTALNTFFTGVKFSVVFGMPQHICVICDYY